VRIALLGTGSADGWPNPFCTCASCSAERAVGRTRRPSAALVDGALLIDCGPTTPHLPAPLLLADVEHVLLTHGHPDHLHPAFLLTRAWAHARHDLHVWGPASAIELCRDWCGPQDPVQLHTVAPGEELHLPTRRGAIHVQALPARHGHGNGDLLASEALLYAVRATDGRALLYATDTGPFDPAEIGLPAHVFDVVLLDATFGNTSDHGTGHLDLQTLPEQIEVLRRHGSIGAATRVYATHLSHHNPPTSALRIELAAMGMELPEDYDVIDTDGSRQASRRTLVLGGARSGKSAYAEALLAHRTDVTYAATGGARDEDPEWQERIDAHRQRRPSTWTTVETTDLRTVLDAEGPVLVDCIALWLTAQLDELDAWARTDAGDREGVLTEARGRIDALADAVSQHTGDVVLVSNEVGMGVVPSTSSGRLFRDLLGIANIALASACDRTVLVVAGQPLEITRAGAGR
jgi:adenosylcobinamide kinase/adenosylcobinamide-phosphate guanylyltransferase